MIQLSIKPLSINEAYSGRRFKTPKASQYVRDVTLMLPASMNTYDKMEIDFVFGFSSRGSDVDNAIKPFLDILQKKYDFNDNQVFKISATKVHTKKPFVKFIIKKYRD